MNEAMEIGGPFLAGSRKFRSRFSLLLFSEICETIEVNIIFCIGRHANTDESIALATGIIFVEAGCLEFCSNGLLSVVFSRIDPTRLIVTCRHLR